MQKLILWLMNPNRRKRPQSVAEVRSFLNKETAKSVTENKAENYDDGTRMPDTTTKKKETPPSGNGFWNKNKIVLISSAAAVVLLILAIILWPKDSELKPAAEEVVEEVEEAVEVEPDAEVSSPIGDYRYYGPLDSNGKPHGQGEAYFGDFRKYTGPFVHGAMQGIGARFTMSNGDEFVGEFRDNRFYYGQYTVKEDGSYFKGTFKNGQPDQGNWYDKNGKRL